MTDGSLRKRSMRIGGHRTSIALEEEFWNVLTKIAKSRKVSMPALIGEIDEKRTKAHPKASLASAVRVFVLLNRA